MESDKELVRAWRAGEKEAFDTLYERYKNSAMRTAFFICKNEADCEDIVQETFITCYLHIQELKQEEDFKAWMMKIMIRKAYRIVEKRRGEIAEEDINKRMEGESGSAPGLLENQLEKEKNQMILSAVRQLPQKQRLVIVLYYYNEMSVEEIAGITGSFCGTVKSRLFTARKKLKRLLSQEVAYENGWI